MARDGKLSPAEMSGDPHPTLVEPIGTAAEVAHGRCTNLPPACSVCL